MGITLSSQVLRHIGRVRSNPASAVAPEELVELERAARVDLEGSQVALASPVAEYTMLSRVSLVTTADSSQIDTIDTFGVPVEIVGLYPEIQALATGTAPPLSAIDVRISRRQGQEKVITAANQTAQAPNIAPDFCSLNAVSSQVANRMLRYRIETPQTLLSFQYRWAVDAATRVAFAWVNVQVSMNVFYRLLTDDERP